MMKNDGWENISGYIKDKLFGNNVFEDYQKILKQAKKEKDYNSILLRQFEELNGHFEFINFRMNELLLKIEDETTDKEFAQKASAQIYKWKTAIEQRTDSVIMDLKTILARMDIIAQIKKEQALRSIPDDILRSMIPWHDTTSPYAMEFARRTQEDVERERKERESR
ncbi:MAG: hypothetical protein MJY76_00925 [Bacteroidales bacterium]|nr:hypothetical protein [Bacteroidales bacterium]